MHSHQKEKYFFERYLLDEGLKDWENNCKNDSKLSKGKFCGIKSCLIK
jgi:hypothetical protein